MPATGRTIVVHSTAMKHFLSLLVLALTAASASAAPPTDADLTSCLGEHGQTLAVFSQLARGMTPTEAAAVFAGADKLDKYSYAHVPAKDCAGAKTFELHFQKDKKTGEVHLYNVVIEFDKALTRNDDFYKRLAAVLVTKYGALKDDKAVEKKILTWGTKIGVAQLSTLGATFPFRLTAPLDKR
jgi:cytochrome c556